MSSAVSSIGDCKTVTMDTGGDYVNCWTVLVQIVAECLAVWMFGSLNIDFWLGLFPHHSNFSLEESVFFPPGYSDCS